MTRLEAGTPWAASHAVFAAAIVSVLINAFPLLTASMLAVGAIVLTGTIKPEQAYSGFANSSVLLVVVAFIVAQAVVKSGLGRRNGPEGLLRFVDPITISTTTGVLQLARTAPEYEAQAPLLLLLARALKVLRRA